MFISPRLGDTDLYFFALKTFLQTKIYLFLKKGPIVMFSFNLFFTTFI